MGLRPSPFSPSLPLLTFCERRGRSEADVTGHHTIRIQRHRPLTSSNADSHDAARRRTARCNQQSPSDRTTVRARFRTALDARRTGAPMGPFRRYGPSFVRKGARRSCLRRTPARATTVPDTPDTAVRRGESLSTAHDTLALHTQSQVRSSIAGHALQLLDDWPDREPLSKNAVALTASSPVPTPPGAPAWH